MTNKAKSDNFDFSAAMQELQDITDYLESDTVEIETAMQKFKRGSELAKEIKTYLQEAENTISSVKASFDK